MTATDLALGITLTAAAYVLGGIALDGLRAALRRRREHRLDDLSIRRDAARRRALAPPRSLP